MIIANYAKKNEKYAWGIAWIVKESYIAELEDKNKPIGGRSIGNNVNIDIKLEGSPLE